MNMQMIMQQAKKMQAQLQKEQAVLESTEYVGTSSMVSVKINGKYEVLDVKISIPDGEEISHDDIDMIEDMFMVAMNDAIGKLTDDKNSKLSKYGQGLSGLM